MISRLGLRICEVFRRTAPDPFVLAVLLTLLTAALAMLLGFEGVPAADRAGRLLDAWGGIDRRPDGSSAESARLGLWTLLGFGMQMCLVLVTGHALAASGPVRRLISRLAAQPRSCAQAAALVSFAACFAAVINWGLGLVVGALLAREVGRSMARRGIAAHYPLLCAAGYTGLMVWHGGLSGSAPLSMTTRAGIEKVSPAMASQLGERTVPLSETLFSPMNLVITLGLVLIVPCVCALLAPRRAEEMAAFGGANTAGTECRPTNAGATNARAMSVPEWFETSPVVVWVLAIGLAAAVWRYVSGAGIAAISLNHVNAAMLALGLALHGSARSYIAAVEDAARGCGGIVVQFPLYAGIMAMMAASGLIARLSEWAAASASTGTLPVLMFISGGVVNLFVPSGGGQWAVQGPIAVSAGVEAGVPVGKMVMSVAYGDQLTNMLQPFWALPLLAITGVKARDIVGYTAIVMVAGAAWIGLWLLVL
ncbi:MAG: short-chain fatty acid transporter [Phycisphaeraceae bacterium]|nr:short-chain fatty acid transporter [Phycisphaeraceae bacterium]